jgi:hypothetical protein
MQMMHDKEVGEEFGIESVASLESRGSEEAAAAT